jgi:hypothetical protein
MEGHVGKTKEGQTMRYMVRVFAVLLVAGAFGVAGLSADGGGDYSAPPAEDNTPTLLADGGGDRGGEPADERTDEVRLADGGGDRSGRPVEDVHGNVLV